jgi:hypothetical protein
MIYSPGRIQTGIASISTATIASRGEHQALRSPAVGLFGLQSVGVLLLAEVAPLSNVRKTTWSSRSAEERVVSPAGIPRPPQ